MHIKQINRIMLSLEREVMENPLCVRMLLYLSQSIAGPEKGKGQGPLFFRGGTFFEFTLGAIKSVIPGRHCNPCQPAGPASAEEGIM